MNEETAAEPSPADEDEPLPPCRESRPKNLLAALFASAAASQVLRPGTTAPAASAPFLAAPPQCLPSTRRVRNGRLRRSMRACLVEGMAAEVVAACAGGAVLTGWALNLQCSPFVVAVLGSLPFLGQILQIPAAWITQTFGRRGVAVVSITASRLVWLALAVLPFLELSPAGQRGVLIGVASANAALAVVGNNAWVAWMGDLVPRVIRGRFFGQRTAYATLSGTIAALGAALALDGVQPAPNLEVLGILAGLASVAGLLGTLLFLRQHDPGAAEHTAFDRRAALAPLRDPGARGFLAYQVAWNAAVGVAATFFALHMLTNLRMGFVLTALHGIAVALVRIVSAPLWGRAIDRVGARPVLIVCSLGIASIPAIWLLPRPDFLWPLIPEIILAGALWSGHGLAAFELPLSVAPRTERPYYIAAFASAGGVAFALASAAGGLLAQSLPESMYVMGSSMVNFHLLFLLSSLLRLGAGLVAFGIVDPMGRPVSELIGMIRAGARGVPLHLARWTLAPFRR